MGSKLKNWNDKIKADALVRNMPIYIRFLKGESIGVLARELGVSKSRIYKIISTIKGKK